MNKGTLQQAFRLTALASAALMTLSAPLTLQARAGAAVRDERQRPDDDQKRRRDDDDDRRRHDGDDDDDRGFNGGLARIAIGQFITPTALEDSVSSF